MEGPVARGVDGDVSRETFGRFYVDGVLAGIVGAVPVVEDHPHTMQVNGVVHHGVVNEGEPRPFAVNEPDRVGAFGELLTVEGPHVTFHVSCKMKFDLSPWRTLVESRDWRFKVGVDEHLPGSVVQSDTGFVKSVLRYHGDGGVA